MSKKIFRMILRDLTHYIIDNFVKILIWFSAADRLVDFLAPYFEKKIAPTFIFLVVFKTMRRNEFQNSPKAKMLTWEK